jgi:predicted transcriptional regulator
MATRQFSIRLDSKLKARVEKEAKRRDRTASFIAGRAIKLYFDELDRLQKELDEAYAEADKGIFISGEKVHAWMASLDTDNPLPFPEPDIFPDSNQKKVA